MTTIPLDIDTSILERNLLLPEFKEDEETFESLLLNKKPSEAEVPWKPVIPTPGYCVKLKTKEGDKVFVNVCHTDSIPPPKDISEEELIDIISSDDLPSFRIPISIGDLHIESDKSHNPCSVYDIAVNSTYYEKKMQASEVFNLFFLNVSIQALDEKYSLDLDLQSDKPYVIMKNRKVLGKLQVHRIQQREIKKAPGELIQTIENTEVGKKKLIEVMDETESNSILIDEDIRIEPPSKFSNHIQMESPKLSPRPAVMEEDVIRAAPLKTNYPTKEDFVTDLSKAGRLKEGSFLSSPEGEDSADEDLPRIPFNPANRPSSDTRISCVDVDANITSSSKHETESGRNLFLIRRYPPSGHPDFLEAIIHLNANSCKEFELKLDNYRLAVTIVNWTHPWFDVTIPYMIDVNKSFGYFIADKKKLIVHMQVEKEGK